MDDREQIGNPRPAEDNQEAEPGPVVPSPIEPSRVVPPLVAPALVDGEEHHVDPRTVRVGRIIGFLVVLPISMVPLILFTIGWGVGGIPGSVYLGILTAWLLIISSLLLLTYRWPAARYRHLRYLVEEDGLRIRRGVFWRKVIWIPITRVQHTDVSQGPIQRKYSLGTLTVHTAGTAGASISVEGLEHGIASRLSDHLRPAHAADAN